MTADEITKVLAEAEAYPRVSGSHYELIVDLRRALRETLARAEAPVVRVGVALLVRRRRAVLFGKRKGSHGAGTWSFPGGHLEIGEDVCKCAAREGEEEADLHLDPKELRKLTFTNDVFVVENKHYITLYVEGECLDEEPKVMEPDKCEEWRWFTDLPSPLFLPVQNLVDSGFKVFG